jgi:hypothetical protein
MSESERLEVDDSKKTGESDRIKINLEKIDSHDVSPKPIFSNSDLNVVKRPASGVVEN